MDNTAANTLETETETAISLLWPTPSYRQEFPEKIKKLGDTAVKDLKIDELCESLVKSKDQVSDIKKILTGMCSDEDVIRYRQDIFDDIMASEGLIDALQDIVISLENLKLLHKDKFKMDDYDLWKYFSRYKELESYVNCVDTVKTALRDIGLKSSGLLHFRDTMIAISESDEYNSLKEVLSKITIDLDEIQSMTLGINLDASLNPMEVTLVSVNKTKFKQTFWMEKYLPGLMNRNNVSLSRQMSNQGLLMSKIHRLSSDPKHPIMFHLHNDFVSLIKPVVRDLNINLRKYSNIRGNILLDLVPELTFYLAFARFLKSVREYGLPLCKPEIAMLDERKCVIIDTYDISLVLHMIEDGSLTKQGDMSKQSDTSKQDEGASTRDNSARDNSTRDNSARDNSTRDNSTWDNDASNSSPPATHGIVLNDIRFDEDGRILILTGPNRGGKTVYTLAAGLDQLLFQAGLFIPGTSACVSPVDSVYTHFLADESKTVELGRLGEEAKRLNEIFGSVTRHSLILLNESLTSTSFTEGLYIAQDVVKSMRYIGVRVLYNTHMHELASYCDTMNDEVAGDSKAVSLITGLVDGMRTYKVKPGAPLGKSYAHDIATKHGVSFEQITKAIDTRRTSS